MMFLKKAKPEMKSSEQEALSLQFARLLRSFGHQVPAFRSLVSSGEVKQILQGFNIRWREILAVNLKYRSMQKGR